VTLCANQQKVKPIRSLSGEPINFRDLAKKGFQRSNQKDKIKGTTIVRPTIKPSATLL
jgi:hypothetical protein